MLFRSTFVPATNFVGTPVTPPTYMACNVIGGNWQPMAPPASCASALVIPTIAPPASPTAVNDTSSGAHNTPQTIAVLGNDTKDPALTLVASSVRLCGTGQTPPNCTLSSLTVPGEGTYTVNPVGTVTFVPLASFSGTVTSSPTYQVADSYGNKVSATITPTVAPPPAPVAAPETKQVVPGGTATFTNLVGTGALASGTGLQTGNTAGPCLVDPSDSVCKDTFTVAGEGTWTVNRLTGSVTFDADPAVTSGTKTAVTYRVTDVAGQTATSTLTPVVPPPATPTDDTSIDALDINQTFNVLRNDTAGTGTTFVVSSVRLCGTTGNQTAPNCTQTSVTVPGEGTYTVNADGTITFDPEPTFAGTATPIGYQVTDSLGRVVAANLTPTVTSTPPTALPDAVSLAAGTSKAFAPLFGAGGLAAPDPSGPALVTSSACLVDPVTSVCGTSVTVPGEGSFVLNPVTGVVTYTADSTATAGTKTSVRYRVTDAVGFVATSTLTPTVWPRPTANPDFSTGAQGKSQTLSPLANDTAGDSSHPLVASTLLLCGAGEAPPACTKTTVSVAGEGTYTVNADGTVTFVPVATFTGTATNVGYVVKDTLDQLTSSTITVKVTGNSTKPVSGTSDTGTSGGSGTSGESGTSSGSGTLSRSGTSGGSGMASMSAPKVVNQRNRTQPATPVYLNPRQFGRPSTNAKFVEAKTRLWDAEKGEWSTVVTTAQGTWVVIRDNVRFVPAKGFTGTATVPFAMTDSAGMSDRAVLTVVVIDRTLPATGSATRWPFVLALMMILAGWLVTRRRAGCR